MSEHKGIVRLAIVATILQLALYTAVIYVAVHFIKKVW